MEILKLKPVCKDYIWGGERLKKEFGKESTGEIIAESWELSCHDDGLSVVDSGEKKGMTLKEYIKQSKTDILGTNAQGFDDFPIMVKLIDAARDLSVQVHPDDDYAMEREKQFGKTEMWYIISAEEDAKIFFGFKKEISKEEFQQAIKDNTVTDLLKAVKVKAGDCFFIEAGTVHAICAGVMVAEIQQSSNVTYRVYDYNRVGVDGKPRELHIEKAIDCAVLAPAKNSCRQTNPIAQCKYFTVDKHMVAGTKEIVVDETSFHHLLVIDGSGEIVTDSQAVEVTKGDSVFIPAGAGKIKLVGNYTVIDSSI